MKNLHYSQHPLIIDGDKQFRHSRFEEALSKYETFQRLLPNLNGFILGRIGITQLRLSMFSDAKESFKELIEMKMLDAKEEKYSVYLAYCYYGLKEYAKAFEYCNRYIAVFGRNAEIENILNSILPDREEISFFYCNDFEYKNVSCANTIFRIAERNFLLGDYEEAEFYANLRINYKDLDVTQGYYLLGAIYQKRKEYYKCNRLIKKLRASQISEREQREILAFLRNIYKNSPCYSIWEALERERKRNALLELCDLFKEKFNDDKITSILSRYVSSLDFFKHFEREVQFQLSRI